MSIKSRGFTIVELLIVIVVIAILAAIAIVAYNGIQARARDTERKSDLSAIAKALKLYNIDKGNHLYNDGCGGSSNSGNGWYSHDYDGAGAGVSMSQCLIDAKYLSQNHSDQSTNCSGLTCHTYIKSTCTGGSYPGTYLYANLETEPQTATDTDQTCSPTYDTGFGSNYVVKVD